MADEAVAEESEGELGTQTEMNPLMPRNSTEEVLDAVGHAAASDGPNIKAWIEGFTADQ